MNKIKGEKIRNSTDGKSFHYLQIIIAEYLLELSEENIIWDPPISTASHGTFLQCIIITTFSLKFHLKSLCENTMIFI